MAERRVHTPLYSLLAALAVAGLAGACTMDPVNQAQEDALGAEPDTGLVPDSEYHRPGQDCLACHGPRGSAKSKFLVAGTVFWGTCIDPSAGPGICSTLTVRDAEVRITDGAGGERCLRTNCAGNFFIRDGEWAGGQSRNSRPTFPLVTSVRKLTAEGGSLTKTMGGHIGRNGSCNDCHRQAPYWNSAGQIYLFDDNDQIVASAQAENDECKAAPTSRLGEEDCEVGD